MGKLHQALGEAHQAFIRRQNVFFTATAASTGRVNVSPKGLDSLRLLSPTRVAYLDLTGSGNETAAHLLQNRRITVMFCSFEKEPLILRIYGEATSLYPQHNEWHHLRPLFGGPRPGERQIVDIQITSVQTSCGFGVPLMEQVGTRDTLERWAERKGPEGVARYQAEHNLQSIDGFATGLPQP